MCPVPLANQLRAVAKVYIKTKMRAHINDVLYNEMWVVKE